MSRLLTSEEPSVRWKVRVKVLGEDPASASVRRLQQHIRRSRRTRALLDGHARLQPGTYAKWQGAHWVLASLADIGYPAGDVDLLPLRDQLLRTWLAKRYYREAAPRADGSGRRMSAVAVVAGRHRRCGSQQGGALLSLVVLGLDDGRCGHLAERLLHWQWPDGGWNCDMRPEAASSSVYETLLPMRGLAAFARATRDTAAAAGAERAAAVLLDRRLLYRRTDGRLIRGEWAQLHYPVYWRYDVLAALKGLAETGRVTDPRCQDGLDLLESRQLPGGGWAAEGRYWRGTGNCGRTSTTSRGARSTGTCLTSGSPLTPSPCSPPLADCAERATLAACGRALARVRPEQ